MLNAVTTIEVLTDEKDLADGKGQKLQLSLKRTNSIAQVADAYITREIYTNDAGSIKIP